MDKLVEVRNVTKRFESHVALNDVSLSVRRGRIFGRISGNVLGMFFYFIVFCIFAL